MNLVIFKFSLHSKQFIKFKFKYDYIKISHFLNVNFLRLEVFLSFKILFSNKEKEPNLFKKRLPYGLIKKSKKSLWQKVTKKRRQQLKLSNSLEINKHLFLNQQLPLAESQLKDNLLAFLPEYHAENVIHKLYERFIQNNKINEHAYLHFYNRISAKVDVLKIIDADQGKNIALNSDMVSKVVSALTDR